MLLIKSMSQLFLLILEWTRQSELTCLIHLLKCKIYKMRNDLSFCDESKLEMIKHECQTRNRNYA